MAVNDIQTCPCDFESAAADQLEMVFGIETRSLSLSLRSGSGRSLSLQFAGWQ